jgi:hypothetical protein
MSINPLHPHLKSMVEHYMKTVQKHLRKVISTHQRDCDVRLPLFLLAYRASTHDTTGKTPVSMVFRRELHLSCNLLFGAPQDKEQPMTNYVTDLVEQMHGIHNYACQHLKVARDSKACCDHVASTAGFHKGDHVWLCYLTQTRKKSPKLQPYWEGPYKVVTQINDIVYQHHPRAKMMAVHLERLAPYLGAARDKKP